MRISRGVVIASWILWPALFVVVNFWPLGSSSPSPTDFTNSNVAVMRTIGPSTPTNFGDYILMGVVAISVLLILFFPPFELTRLYFKQEKGREEQ